MAEQMLVLLLHVHRHRMEVVDLERLMRGGVLVLDFVAVLDLGRFGRMVVGRSGGGGGGRVMGTGIRIVAAAAAAAAAQLTMRLGRIVVDDAGQRAADQQGNVDDLRVRACKCVRVSARR